MLSTPAGWTDVPAANLAVYTPVATVGDVTVSLGCQAGPGVSVIYLRASATGGSAWLGTRGGMGSWSAQQLSGSPTVFLNHAASSVTTAIDFMIQATNGARRYGVGFYRVTSGSPGTCGVALGGADAP